MVNTNTQEQEWIPQIGDVIYTVGSNNHQEVWDDTELIEHWDSAMEEYRVGEPNLMTCEAKLAIIADNIYIICLCLYSVITANWTMNTPLQQSCRRYLQRKRILIIWHLVSS
ncbi:hypothetical protein BX666DRAFT_533692 [Dichotomocladium elegans]|nr:hypothetical protein BX666DRAFT_533692 [Dichotomocladium elegans]